jgi:hypothetical protein
MYHLKSIDAQDLIFGIPEQGFYGRIGIRVATVQVQIPDPFTGRVKDRPEFLFALAQRVLCSLLLIDIPDRTRDDMPATAVRCID